MIVVRRRCFCLRRLNVLVLVDDWNVVQWLSKRDILVLVLKLLLVVVRGAEPLPRQGIYE